jgi:multiple sugar transport system ATP-binding protein
VIQQVDTPGNLYEHPQNLFVAGFIGSPSMNFLPGRVENGSITTPVGQIPMPDSAASNGRDVIVGIRPEHFEDAAVEGDVPDRTRFRTTLDVVESMGSELYVYFDVKSEQMHTAELDELAADAGLEDLPSHGEGQQVVARLSAESSARPGREVELSIDTTRLQLFDETGGRLATE